MHELSLMEGIMGLARNTAQKHRFSRIKLIKLCVGAMTAAYPVALQAAFEALGTDPLFAGAVLEIEEVPLLALCQGCQREFSPATCRFICPDCGAIQVDIIRGRELYVDYIEGE